MGQFQTAEWFRDEFLQLARRLDDAIRQEKKTRHLVIRKVRLETLAARFVVRAVNAGHFDAYPKLRENLRRAWTGKLPGGTGTIMIDQNGRIRTNIAADVAPDDGKPLSIAECTDERLARLWVFPVVHVLQTIQPDRFEGSAGKCNFRTVRTDSAGRPVGKDGEPLKMVRTETVDPRTGVKHITGKLNGEFAFVEDDYDELDATARERFRVEDSASACLTLADLLSVDDAGVTLTADELVVLEALCESHPRRLLLIDLETKTRFTSKTVRGHLDRLIELGLAVRPSGKRQGATATPEGRRFYDSCPDKTGL